MSEPDQIPPQWPCRRCEHPLELHTPDVGCQVELSTGPVPSLEFGGLCSCQSFVYEPASEPKPAPESEPELLDGPVMYAKGLALIRRARGVGERSKALRENDMRGAAVYFAGASAAALAELVADNGTGDIAEQRWRAALAGKDVLPEDGQP